MKYRKWNNGDRISALGFGAMRMPLLEDNEVDVPRAVAMIRKAIDDGVNYLDTAWPYHEGKSEEICGEAMKEGYRDKVRIATKLPSWEITKREDMDRILDKQMERLQVDKIDYYLLHSLTEKHWKMYKQNDYRNFLLQARESGKIDYLGFSFHDQYDLFEEIVDDFPWDFVQIQLNYLDENYQAGLKGMRYAQSKGMDVIVMEPLRGGTLAPEEIPVGIQKILEKDPKNRTMAAWALSYLWDMSEVSLVLSGMSTEDQLSENIRTASDTGVRSLTSEDRALLQELKNYFQSRLMVNCTNCRYCMPCPSGVEIPEAFWAYNHGAMFEDTGKAKFWINGFLSKEKRPSQCTECGICEDQCPQGIPIREHLKKITELYEAV